MKEKSKVFLKAIGVECLFMLSAAAVACLAMCVQFIGKKYIGTNSGLFRGYDYRYNMVSYIAGTAIYFLYLIFSYKMIFRNYINLLSEYKIGMKILAWFICAAFSAGMSVIMIIGYIYLLGFSNTIDPDCLMFVTCIGWPVITAILFAAILVGRSVRASKKHER